MKKFNYILLLILLSTACEDEFLDLERPDALSESSYFKTADHFRTAANAFYNNLWAWNWHDGGNAQQLLLDRGSDLNLYFTNYGRGNITLSNTDVVWTDSYKYIRGNNILLEKAGEYSGEPEEIAEYVAAARFFRAYNYFFLLQRFGGVPVVTTVLDINSPELMGKRNSRYEVFYQVKNDLEAAIEGLPREAGIGTSDKGHISREAAQSLLARALLFEATWEKYVGTTTDGDGMAEGAGTAKPEGYPSVDGMLAQAVTLSKDIMDNGGFELWNYNEELNNLTMYYLFNLEDSGSNPAGLDKSTNKEFIFYSKYDYVLRQGRTNISHASYYSSMSQNYMDMFLCTDGLPIDKSPLFQGYQTVNEQWENRDYRLYAYGGTNEQEVVLPADESMLQGGYNTHWNRKFRSYDYPNYREAATESSDFPHIRLAEVYLIYAEALYELNGTITDAELNESLNPVRERSGVAPLTNAMAAAYNLDILEEIRRERTVELFQENSRYNDLRRWGIAEEVLNEPVFGPIIEGTDYENNPDLYDPSAYQYGEAVKPYTGEGPKRAIVADSEANRSWSRSDYLLPIPVEEINLNGSLLQNPGY
ncbi:RagB/SusD family nutrient uptake outer membrane protein [Sinomicrobium pectinilyticum]|uniref:RagB/SusD family nutrient uptake outer membrane protein n=1 Tax=Sinomicrobium pectinilyticum TaxID=1084421 RepID=A0A3N0E3I1_SINP1|nr:RagB/SusD family nutrient uptake outer membrane protein [Sinomicrobium pectinilyticum]RNL82376.1 RagB/SusD family nutrient uptake outer membrane protein [Sinomicrobium pectinilyticum]